jgi:DHA1 family tetracycline resistance protein-like MFS transporter
MTSVASRPGSIYPILAVNFAGTLGFSIVLPFLVFLVIRLGGNALIYGVMGATYSLFQLVGAPLLGRWSDRFGRKRLLLVSQLGTAVSWAVFLAALALPATPMVAVRSSVLGAFTVTVPLAVLFVARALDGITGGNVSVANAYLADITAEEARSANFGKMAVSGNLGFVVGPALAGILGATAWGATAPVVAALVISLGACLLIAVGLRESSPCVLSRSPERPTVRKMLGQEQKECYRLRGAQRATLRELWRMPALPRLLVLNLLVFLAFNLFYVAFPVYVAHDLGWSLADTGAFFAVTSLLMVAVQGPVLARASRRWSARTLVLGGSAILAASFPCFASASTAVIYAGAALLALGNGLMWPSLLAALSSAAGARVQGAVQGLASSGGAVASIAGLLVGGVLFTALAGRVFLVAAAITALVVLLAVGMPRLEAAPDRSAAGAG